MGNNLTDSFRAIVEHAWTLMPSFLVLLLIFAIGALAGLAYILVTRPRASRRRSSHQSETFRALGFDIQQ